MKAERLAGALSDRLERHLSSLPMEMSHYHNHCLIIMPEGQIGKNQSNAKKTAHDPYRELDKLLKTIR